MRQTENRNSSGGEKAKDTKKYFTDQFNCGISVTTKDFEIHETQDPRHWVPRV